MTKRKSKEVIESFDDDREHAFIKFPGKELVNASEIEEEGTASVDYKKIARLMKQNKAKSYGTAHDHDYDIPIPSVGDLRNLLGDDKQKYMAISQKDPDRKLSGYFFLKKTKKTPKMDFSLTDFNDPELKQEYKDRHKGVIGKLKLLPIIGKTIQLIYRTRKFEKNFNKSAKPLRDSDEFYETPSLDALDEFCKKYNLRYKFVPAKDYQFDSQTLSFQKKLDLEQRASLTGIILNILSISSFLISFIFLTSNLTGKVIWNLNKTNSIGISFIFFMLGLMFLFFFLKKKN